jgi:hypothetical protein
MDPIKWLIDSVLGPIWRRIQNYPWWVRLLILLVIISASYLGRHLIPSQPEIVRFSADPNQIKVGDEVTITWEVKKARAVSIHPDIGSVTPAGSRRVSPKKTTVYSLTATNLFFRDTASHEIQVKTTPQPTAKPRVISFRHFTRNRFLQGDEYALEGIVKIKPVIGGAYCVDAQLALLQPAEHDPPESFLTTARNSNVKECNTLPVSFEFADPVRSISIEFSGAAVPYELNAFDSKNHLIGQSTKNAQAYSTEIYTVTFASPYTNIARITFGYEGAVTQIKQIKFQR